MKIHFMVVRRVPAVPSPLLVEVARLLHARGVEVDSSTAEELLQRPDRLAPRHDVYVLKSHTELSLSVAGILHDQGARFLNPYPSCVTAQDKLVTARRLAAAGVPVPRSWTTADPRLLVPLLMQGPLVIKPHRGHRGAGVHIVHTAADITAMPPATEPVIVQDYVPGTGEDLKVYVVGDHVAAVRKPFTATSHAAPGRPCPVTDEVREIALLAGRAFGLGLYGVDIIEGPAGPVVVDLNYFPGYKGLPDIAPLIADLVEDFARRRIDLELPPFPATPTPGPGSGQDGPRADAA
jgi:ribosomal protein S6--L-glutamate ligase